MVGLPSLGAVEVVMGDVTYEVGATLATVKDCDGAATGPIVVPGTVVDPGSMAPVPVVGVDSDAFRQCNDITSISLPASVVSIGEEAFYSCDDLQSVNIPVGVTAIEPYTFGDCEELASLTLPDGILTIGEGAFSGCYLLPSINIPASVTFIDIDVFYDCEEMQSIDVDPLNATFTSVDGVMFSKDLTTLIRCPCGRPGPSYAVPHGTLHLEYYAFEYCVNLSEITLPSSLQTIDEWAFYYTQQVTEIYIPDSVTSIGSSAFRNCSGLTGVVIGSGVSTIGENAFGSCDDLLGFEVNPLNNNFTEVDGVLFSKDQSTLLRFPAGLSGSYAVPVGTTAIADNAFTDSELLTSVSLPDGLISIGTNAFDDCEGLTRMVFPASVTNIGSSAFNRCDHLVCVQFLGHAPTVGPGAFPIFIIEFEFKARVGATGYDAGYFASQTVRFELAITEIRLEPSGDIVLTTDALNSNGLTVLSSSGLSGFTPLEGVTDVGSNGFLIPAMAGDTAFFLVEFDDGI